MTNMKMWKTKDGRKIRIRDMSDDYIMNTMNLLRRNAVYSYNNEINILLSASDFLHGDGALLAVDLELANTINDDWSDYVDNIYYDMEDELTKRGVVQK